MRQFCAVLLLKRVVKIILFAASSQRNRFIVTSRTSRSHQIYSKLTYLRSVLSSITSDMNDYFLSSNRCIFLLYSFNFPGAGSIGFLCSVGQNIWPHELRQLSGLPKILNLIDYWGFHKFGIITNKRNKISWQGWVFWKILWVSHALVVWTCTLCMPVNHKDPKGARLCQRKLHANPAGALLILQAKSFVCWQTKYCLSGVDKLDVIDGRMFCQTRDVIRLQEHGMPAYSLRLQLNLFRWIIDIRRAKLWTLSYLIW